MHELKIIRNKEYLRKKIGVKQKWLDQYLTNNQLRGKVDEVLQLEDGTMAPLDYKFAEYKDRIFETYRQQVYCYAVLIEDNFKTTVNRGYLVYIRSKNKLIEVQVRKRDKELIRESIGEMGKIIQQNFFPRATKYKRRCVNCTYRNICIQ